MLNKIQFNSQLITPSKIVCIGRNYVDHITELGNAIPKEMVVFMKPNSAITQQLMATHQEPLHFEAELAFLYQGGRFSAVGAGLDLTKRGLQNRLKEKGLPWERSKAFDGSALFSEFVAIDSLDDLSIELDIDGAPRQRGSVTMMMYSPDVILKQLQPFMTLQDGDVVMTGTPKGVGEVSKGSLFEARVKQRDKLLVTQTWKAR
ncbi:fumarylacetoacetate hydrolase family protein [Thalassotalea mangrovi]|uniref:Fumarylacetoacetate hydrolase family protein n=1 Tax=Thalassotalea mangrovi TaxID=2572245 RepID=A0A4V5NUR7_9GAMM|nr:fumarylacetoacetate hydrolase family protein [Thalassotalea mangrovi]TKB47512.1 fumarylacetoacetate hydrolase family protein [Thalassotalea mangrovi]